MKYQVNLSRNTLIFYSLLAPFIIAGSLANLGNIISGKGSVHVFGAFALFGFVLLPALIMMQYIRNKCVISDDKMTIGKQEYNFSAYRCYIVEKQLPLKDRPLFSLLRKNYYDLVIKDLTTGKIAFTKSLDISAARATKMKHLLSNS